MIASWFIPPLEISRLYFPAIAKKRRKILYAPSFSGATTSAITASNSVYTPCVQFTFSGTSTPTPPTVTLNAPKNGAIGIFNPSLSFTLVNAKQYQIQMAEGTGAFVTVQNWTDGNGNISYQTNLLKSNTTYSWKVVAKNDDGETTSEVYTFTTKAFAAPDPITEVNPENGSELTSDPLLSWTFGENTEQYQVLLAKEDNELDIVSFISTYRRPPASFSRGSWWYSVTSRCNTVSV